MVLPAHGTQSLSIYTPPYIKIPIQSTCVEFKIFFYGNATETVPQPLSTQHRHNIKTSAASNWTQQCILEDVHLVKEL